MLTVRMNWMDVDKSCSADVQLSKDSKDIPIYHRNKLYHHRAQVASVIRHQLAAIQRELNGDLDETQTDESKAAEALTALIKGQRYRDGKLYTCYIDGTSHEGCEAVTSYNSYCRQRLDQLLETNKDITALVPDASEFDVSGVDQLMDEEADLAAQSNANRDDVELADRRTQLQKKIDGARKVYNDKAAKCSRYLTSFVAIRGAKLAEGYDPATVEHKRTPTHSFAAQSAEPTAAAEEQTAVEEEAPVAPEEPTEEVAAVPEEKTEEETVAADSNAALLNAEEGPTPVLRDATEALGSTQ